MDMDAILGRIETFVVDEEKRGGMTAQARERLEKTLRSFQDRGSHASVCSPKKPNVPINSDVIPQNA